MSSVATAVERRSALGAQVLVIRCLEALVFGGLAFAYLGLFVVVTARGYQTFDFKTFWQSGHDVLHGHSPYPQELPTAAHRQSFRPFVYPAPAAVAMVPFALIPFVVANILWAVAGVCAVAGSLRLLGVRDWRCYGAAFAWPAVWSSIDNGAISVFLVLGCAALWRYRDRAYVAGALVAALVLLKLYLWPLGVFLLATRRWRAALTAVVGGAAGTLAGWAVIGFDGLSLYPRLLGRLTTLVGNESYSFYALSESLGAGPQAAKLLMVAAGGLILVAAVVRARRGDGEAAGFVLTIAASLALTPIVWPHYFGLVCIAVALARPYFSPAWLLPMFILVPAWSAGHPLLIVAAVVPFAGIFAWSARSLVRGPATPRGFGSSWAPVLSKSSA
jgi:Glycosyltransferase family 87